MKYLKRFNERLNSQTYKRAARKLNQMGHSDRSKKLVDFSKEAEKEESLSRWEERANNYWFD